MGRAFWPSSPGLRSLEFSRGSVELLKLDRCLMRTLQMMELQLQVAIENAIQRLFELKLVGSCPTEFIPPAFVSVDLQMESIH